MIELKAVAKGSRADVINEGEIFLFSLKVYGSLFGDLTIQMLNNSLNINPFPTELDSLRLHGKANKPDEISVSLMDISSKRIDQEVVKTIWTEFAVNDLRSIHSFIFEGLEEICGQVIDKLMQGPTNWRKIRTRYMGISLQVLRGYLEEA